MTIKAIESSKGPAQVFEPYAFRGVKNSVRSGVNLILKITISSYFKMIDGGIDETRENVILKEF